MAMYTDIDATSALEIHAHLSPVFIYLATHPPPMSTHTHTCVIGI